MVWRAAAFLTLLLVLPATAQLVLIEDPEGDQKFSLRDGSFRVPTADQYRNVDLVEVGLWSEEEDKITFFVRPEQITDQSEHPVPYEDPVYEIYFTYGLQAYRVLVTTFLENQGTAALGSNPQTFGELQIADSQDVFQPLQSIEAEVDTKEGVILADVPRAAILDDNQAPLIRNATLTGISSTATALGWFGFTLPLGQTTIDAGPPMVWDRAPDSRFDDASHKLLTGPSYSTGHLLAGSADPVRWTNGEATTFVYTVRLTNTGDQDLDVTMSQTGMPERWQVAFSDRYKIEAQSHINVTVHVAIPFSHQHGVMHPFQVHFDGVDGSKATARLGVYWPLVPQPAGHHDMLWFHGRIEPAANPFEDATSNDVHGWISAATPLVDTRDTSTPIPADQIEVPPSGRAQAHWRIALEPTLRMGLDFDLKRMADGEVRMNFPTTVVDPVLRMDIKHQNREFILTRTTTIASATSSQTGSFSGEVQFTFPDMDIRPKADLIEYVPVADLEINLTLEATMVGFGFENPPEYTPTLLPKSSWLQLPLFEYHDPLEATFTTDASARIVVGSEGVQKPVNPGEQVVYNMTLIYEGAFDQKFRIELSGHEDWAHVLGADEFVMEPGQRREVAFAVAPPMQAPEGTIDTTVRCISTANAAVQAGMTVRTQVLRGEDIADETVLAEEKAEGLAAPVPAKPFPWGWLIVGIVAVLAAAAVAVWRLKPEWLGL